MGSGCVVLGREKREYCWHGCGLMKPFQAEDDEIVNLGANSPLP